MSDTPQSDEVINEEVNAEVATNDSVLESDTSNQVQDESNEQVDEVELAKQKANEAFNKQYGEKKQLERELAAQREENAKFQQAERERQAAQVGNLPEFPDEFDDNFEEKKVAYVNALQEQANFNAQNSIYTQQQEAVQLQQQQAAQAEAMQLQNDFVSKSKAAGASDQEFNNIVNTLNNGGMTQQGAKAIMSLGEDGYFIAKHLAANVMEASEFNSLDPIQQGMKLVELKQKASALKPKTSNAPEPATNLQGNGVDPEMGKYPLIKGAKFE
jgi:hypothetical protein